MRKHMVWLQTGNISACSPQRLKDPHRMYALATTKLDSFEGQIP